MTSQEDSGARPGGWSAGSLAWGALIIASLGYSIYATVDTVWAVRQMPVIGAEKPAAQRAREQYSKVKYYVAQWRTVSALTKNCQKLRAENVSYSGFDEVLMYRRFLALRGEGKHDEAAMLLRKIATLAGELDVDEVTSVKQD